MSSIKSKREAFEERQKEKSNSNVNKENENLMSLEDEEEFDESEELRKAKVRKKKFREYMEKKNFLDNQMLSGHDLKNIFNDEYEQYIFSSNSNMIKNPSSDVEIEFLWGKQVSSCSLTLREFTEHHATILEHFLSSLDYTKAGKSKLFLETVRISPVLNYPKALQPKISKEMYAHQLESLHSMLTKEAESPGGIGFLSDDTGLGKSLTTISLIVSSPCSLFDNISNNLDRLQESLNNGYYFRLKATLLFVPPTLIEQWKSEFKEIAPSLNVEIYYHSKGSNNFYKEIKNKNLSGFKRLYEADVIILSSQIRESTFDFINTHCFHRVIIDESHREIPPIKLVNIVKKFTWFITATPFKGSHILDCASYNGIARYFSEIWIKDDLFKISIGDNTGVFSFRDLIETLHKDFNRHPERVMNSKIYLKLLSTLMIVHLKCDYPNLIKPGKNKEELIVMSKADQDFFNFYKKTRGSSSTPKHLINTDLVKLRQELIKYQLKKNGKECLISQVNPYKNNDKFIWTLERLKDKAESTGGIINSVICVQKKIELMCLRDLLLENGIKVYYFDASVSNYDRGIQISSFQRSINDLPSFKMFLRSTVNINRNRPSLRYLTSLNPDLCRKIGGFLFQPAVFILMKHSGSFGLNLQCSSELIYFGHMSETQLIQVTGRIKRIGQTKTPTNIRVRYAFENDSGEKLLSVPDLYPYDEDILDGFTSLVNDTKSGFSRDEEERIIEQCLGVFNSRGIKSSYLRLFIRRFLQFYEWNVSYSCEQFINYYRYNILTLRLSSNSESENYLIDSILRDNQDELLTFCKKWFILQHAKASSRNKNCFNSKTYILPLSNKCLKGWNLENSNNVFSSKIKTDLGLVSWTITYILGPYFRKQEQYWSLKNFYYGNF